MQKQYDTLSGGSFGSGWIRNGKQWMVMLVSVCAMAVVSCGGGGGGGGGLVVAPPHDIVYEKDTDADGVADEIMTFKHNLDGDIVLLEMSDDTATVMATAQYHYDADGNLERTEFYDGGTLDMIMEFFYNPSGQVLTVEGDENGDGTIDFCVDNSYNGDGRLELQEQDLACDGTVEFTKAYGWDGDGNLLWKEESFGGVTNAVSYTYDAAGNLSTILYDDGDDGIVEDVDTLVWNPGAAGTENYMNRMVYSMGYFHPELFLAPYRMVRHLDSVEHDEGDDGTVDKINMFHYDTGGRISLIEEDEDNDGHVDRTERLIW